MRTWHAWDVILLAVIFIPSAFASEPAQNQLLNLPEGDSLTGRQTFRELKCFSCHRIAGDIEMSSPVTLKEAPTLGLKQARYKPYFIADSIVFPSHVIASSAGASDGLSRMGDFSDSMTVKQLADLVAYLKQLDEEV